MTLLTLIVTLGFSLTSYYQVSELRFYDFRLLAWAGAPVTTESDLYKVGLYTKRDSTVEHGLGDAELVDLIRGLDSLGSRIVILGTELFDDYEAIADLLPSKTIIVSVADQQPEEQVHRWGERALFRDSVDLDVQKDSDGVLRSLEAQHPAIQLWGDLGYVTKGSRLYLKPRPVANRESREFSESDLPLEQLAEVWNNIEQGSEFFRRHGATWAGRTVLLQKGKTTASEVTEVAAPGGEFTAGHIHLMLYRSLLDGWTLTRPSTFVSILFLVMVLLAYSAFLSNRQPITIALTPIFLFLGAVAVSFGLLPLGVDLPVVMFGVGLFWATLFISLIKIVKGRRVLQSFGGVEDALFRGEEAVATMVFTNLPPFLLQLERNHDDGLLRYRREYNEILARAAQRYHGKVLDYQGDAQMLGFGLRHDEDTDHAAEGTAAALDIIEEVKELAERWQTTPEQLDVHAGVCTGTIALGHVGAVQKQDIAAIGDTTNTAARLMGAAMKKGVGVLVSRATAEMADGVIEGDEVDPVELKGKSARVEVLHARSVCPEWRAKSEESIKDVLTTSGTLSYRGATESDLLITLALTFFAVVLTFAIWSENLLEGMERELFDRTHQSVGLSAADPDIVLVGIDRDSIEDPQLGGFPYSRAVYAAVLDNLLKTDARGIFVDVLFKEAREEHADRSLARVLESDPRIVVAGVLHRDERHRLGPPRFFPAVNVQMLEARNQVGLIHNKLDDDGSTRSGFLGIRETASHGHAEKEKRRLYPSAAVALMLGRDDQFRTDGKRIQIGERWVYPSVDDEGNSAVLLRFGPAATAEEQATTKGGYEVVSFRRLLDPSDPIFSQLDGRYVMIGQTVSDGAAGEIDRVTTVVGRLKGVEVHARLLDNLLNGTYFRKVSNQMRIASVLVVAGLLLWILTRYREPKAYLGRLVALIVCLTIFYLFCFVFFSYVFELMVLYLAIALISVCVLTGRNILTFNALTRVVPTEVALELLFKQTASDRRQVATVLLTDIRGYTTLSEGKTAVAMLDVLNEYHKRTVACYERYGGQALTYQGDAQIMVFGVFGKRTNPAKDAVASALELQEICTRLRSEWGIEKEEDFSVGAGLCTGEVEVGWLGDSGNLQYTVVGETVRKAHKVQSLSEILKAPVIMDEETYAATQGEVSVDDLGLVQPKGAPKGMRLYRGRGVKAEESDKEKRTEVNGE